MDGCGGMGGGWMGAYGGLWGPSLLVVVVAAVVVTLVKQEHKERGGPLTVLSGLRRMATAPKWSGASQLDHLASTSKVHKDTTAVAPPAADSNKRSDREVAAGRLLVGALASALQTLADDARRPGRYSPRDSAGRPSARPRSCG